MRSDETLSAEQWFSALLAQDENDPDALTDDLVLDVTEQIYRAMQDAGLRPSNLAERMNVSRSFVSQLLNGRPNMTMRTLIGVALALGLRVQIELRPAAQASSGQLDIQEEGDCGEMRLAEPRHTHSDETLKEQRMRSPDLVEAEPAALANYTRNVSGDRGRE
jgi:transcriptional regulator with XRE-family HTH domain